MSAVNDEDRSYGRRGFWYRGREVRRGTEGSRGLVVVLGVSGVLGDVSGMVVHCRPVQPGTPNTRVELRLGSGVQGQILDGLTAPSR